MVRRVYERVEQSGLFTKVVVATDHVEIEHEVQSFGGNVRMTSSDHPSGTDRCEEIRQLENDHYDYIVNIQGDEPLIHKEQLKELISCLDKEVQIASQYKFLSNLEEVLNPAQVKLVLNKKEEAMYFSRSPIPYLRGIDPNNWTKDHAFKGHIGLYAYRSDILEKIAKLSPSQYEEAESLEQLRWLENGYKIKMVATSHQSIGIDTPDDVAKVMNILEKE